MTTMTKRFNTALLASLVATTLFSVPQAMAAPDEAARGGRGGHGHGGGQRAEKMFARLDVNEDGAISLTELTDPTAAKAEKKLARKDGDEDGVLSLAEFQQNRHGNAVDLSAIADDIVQCVADVKAETGDDNIVVPTADQFTSSEDRFAGIDSNADGVIDLAELEAALLGKANNGFSAMDADADTSVTLEEFTAHHTSRKATKKAIRQCVHDINDADEV
ncbi:MAG: Ca2+-binding EF-hand superfamily protein [Phenylobacterium sp.]|jgi:Ca2+-binding EF-hand superfamily protein